MNKSVKKIIVTSASLLMMASVGAGIGTLSRPVHAESNAEIAKSLRSLHPSIIKIDKRTPEQKRDDARATAWANKVDMNEDIKAHESEGMTRSQAIAHENAYEKQKQARMKKADYRTTRKHNRRARKRSHKRIHKAKRYARKHKQARKHKRTKGFYFSNVWSAALKHNQKGLRFAKQKHNYRLMKNIKRAIKHDKKMLKMSARFSPKSQAKQRKLAAERDNAYENKVATQTLAQER